MYAIVQFLELRLSSAGELPREELRSHVESLKNETERLQSLLGDLRSLVRSKQLKLKVVSLGDIAAEILNMERQHYNNAGIQTQLDFPSELPPLMADREKMKQALLNLCKNAAEEMPQGGKLALRARQNRHDIVLEVADSGPGIPTEVDVFELFTTTKQNGLGLGAGYRSPDHRGSWRRHFLCLRRQRRHCV